MVHVFLRGSDFWLAGESTMVRPTAGEDEHKKDRTEKCIALLRCFQSRSPLVTDALLRAEAFLLGTRLLEVSMAAGCRRWSFTHRHNWLNTVNTFAPPPHQLELRPTLRRRLPAAPLPLSDQKTIFQTIWESRSFWTSLGNNVIPFPPSSHQH